MPRRENSVESVTRVSQRRDRDVTLRARGNRGVPASVSQTEREHPSQMSPVLHDSSHVLRRQRTAERHKPGRKRIPSTLGASAFCSRGKFTSSVLALAAA